jgi:phospholipase C
MEPLRTWAYAVKPGDSLTDVWPLSAFGDSRYHLRVYGPNGFYREFTGDKDDPAVDIRFGYERSGGSTPTAPDARPSGPAGHPLSGNGLLQLRNNGDACTVTIVDHAYKTEYPPKPLAAGEAATVTLALSKNQGWHDFTVRVNGHTGFAKRYAGRIETGRDSISDPKMGNAGQV